MTDAQLIAACLKGDPKAQRVLFDQYTRPLYQVSLRYSKTRMDAEDALQDAWVNIFKGLSTYREEGKLESWMKRIVIHSALRKQRVKWFKNENTDIEKVNDPSFSPQALSQMTADEILGYVLNLPAGYKEIFTLFVIEGYSHKEIGLLLGIEASTSRSKLTRARKKMQSSILLANKNYANVS